MKRFKMLLVVLMLLFSTNVMAEGWDFYFFGVNTKTFKDANYLKVAAGVATSIAVHTAGHYIYAGFTNINVTQDGFREVISGDYTNTEAREFAQAGFLAQSIGGLILTSIPYTRQSDFTKGYVAMEFLEVATYPMFWQGTSGDFNMSDRHNGDKDWEYAGHMAVAIHNMLRINWEKQ